MGASAAYDQAMAQFQACLHTYGDSAWQAMGFCGYSAGYAYGANATVQTLDAWQAAAWFALALAALGWALAAWLLWQSRKKVPAC